MRELNSVKKKKPNSTFYQNGQTSTLFLTQE
ncbi:hypothetical protein HD_1930 [[Haemophilus] ducreyi 35000HP]|uniref:Uncharacterized protein n=1 Tax=Haemophilus ducreyi (strain 35000HP / ATCC 700724) TaxID=233412 RepID=Q7VKH7_HAEDU|nr:hypothetical protein HD_1930 [[Haemophilus] ducreyi 35000HP]